MSKEAWMETFSGKKIYLSNPKVEDICLSDIAIALSHICRFGGHVSQPYSVASHSLAVMHLVREMRPDSDPKTLRTALFHDATEAYLGDIIRPFKMMDIMSPYRDLEDVWWKVIAEKFDLHDPIPDVVKYADEIALAVERDRLRPISLRDWNGLCDADEAVKVIGNMVSTLSDPRGVAKKFYRKAEALGVVELVMGRVLFLDIDGVLNGREFLIRTWSGSVSLHESAEIDPSRVSILNRIVDETGCKVILSSSWRAFGLPSVGGWIRSKGGTFFLDGETPQLASGIRGQEIDMWLKTNGKDTESFCILDDSHDIDPHKKNWIQCNPATGITEENARDAITMLKGYDR